MKNKIAIVAGEPFSVNSEIIAKSWKKLKINIRRKYLLLEIIF